MKENSNFSVTRVLFKSMFKTQSTCRTQNQHIKTIVLLYRNGKYFFNSSFYVYGHLPACMSAPLAYLLPTEARRENRILQDRSYRWLWATKWVLGTKHKSSGRAANVLNYWTIKIGDLFNLCICLLLDGARVVWNAWSTCTCMFLSMQKSRRCFYLPLLPSVYYLG